MKWIKLFEEFDDYEMSITAFFEELGLEGEYEHASLDGVNFYTLQVPTEKDGLITEAFEVLQQRLYDYNISASAMMASSLGKCLTIVTYDRRNLDGVIEKWVQEAHRRVVDWMEDDNHEDYKQKLINEIEIVESVKVDSVNTNSFDVFKLNNPPFHVRLNIDYGKGPDGIWYNDLDNYIAELKWSLIGMLYVELGMTERSLALFKLEKINI